MFKNSNFIIIVMFLLFISSCSNTSGPSATSGRSGDWLIPQNQVYDGGPGKDGIPALEEPPFNPVSETNYLSNTDLVIVYKKGSLVKAYSHDVLNWHEIVNDDFDGEKITISLCPLTGTGIGIKGIVEQNGNQVQTTFGVSGLLYNNNLILYDRLTDSYWSQIKNQSVNGTLKGQYPESVHVIETTFGTLKQFYPNALILSNQTGVYSSGQYNRYPYGDYRTNNNYLIFPLSTDDTRLPRKERVLGLYNDRNQTGKVYQFKHFKDSTRVIIDTFEDRSVIVIGNGDLNFISAFELPDFSGQDITFMPLQARYPHLMKDSLGNYYDFFGEILQGPNAGYKLKAVPSFIGYWFSWGAFYPGIEIYGQN